MLRNRADDRERYDLWALDTATGEWRMLVDSQKVGTGAAPALAAWPVAGAGAAGDRRPAAGPAGLGGLAL